MQGGVRKGLRGRWCVGGKVWHLRKWYEKRYGVQIDPTFVRCERIKRKKVVKYGQRVASPYRKSGFALFHLGDVDRELRRIVAIILAEREANAKATSNNAENLSLPVPSNA